ncbi:uncharacterized protein LOC134474300 isoform X2 [Cavia porcellus]|uniref:uncharacterized protein LOC134474300 isoform X2 n=1 Tax=Cavia porcellus TaxID=10141 RepID=UPI002FE205A7
MFLDFSPGSLQVLTSSWTILLNEAGSRLKLPIFWGPSIVNTACQEKGKQDAEFQQKPAGYWGRSATLTGEGNPRERAQPTDQRPNRQLRIPPAFHQRGPTTGFLAAVRSDQRFQLPLAGSDHFSRWPQLSGLSGTLSSICEAGCRGIVWSGAAFVALILLGPHRGAGGRFPTPTPQSWGGSAVCSSREEMEQRGRGWESAEVSAPADWPRDSQGTPRGPAGPRSL